MEVEEINFEDMKEIINKIPIDLEQVDLKYNPLEVFVNRVHEKEICHSAIIADLFNPKGEHKLGDAFLSSFLKEIEVDSKEINIDNVKIETERTAASSLPNKGKRKIDICIYDEENKKAIIIENKINNAGEQEKQISDYKNGLEEDGYKVLKTVCVLSPLGNRIKDADCYIAPSELASILEKPILEKSKLHIYCGVMSYITLLKNMDEHAKRSKIAKVILENNITDNDFKKLREIAISFYENIPEQVLRKTAEAIKEKKNSFKEGKEHDGGDIYRIMNANCLQLWHDKSYFNGPNKGFWIEVWFYDYNRFEIWIIKDKDAELEFLTYYKPSTNYADRYVDKDVNSIANGTEAKKFDFPNEEEFNKMIEYLYKLYCDLYQIPDDVNK